MSTKLSVRLPEALASRLSQIAEETQRPKSFYIQRALELYMAEPADLHIAYVRLHDTSVPVISIEDMRNDLGL